LGGRGSVTLGKRDEIKPGEGKKVQPGGGKGLMAKWEREQTEKELEQSFSAPANKKKNQFRFYYG